MLLSKTRHHSAAAVLGSLALVAAQGCGGISGDALHGGPAGGGGGATSDAGSRDRAAFATTGSGGAKPSAGGASSGGAPALAEGGAGGRPASSGGATSGGVHASAGGAAESSGGASSALPDASTGGRDGGDVASGGHSGVERDAATELVCDPCRPTRGRGALCGMGEVTWECRAVPIQPLIIAACRDAATNLPRYCCPADLGVQCFSDAGR